MALLLLTGGGTWWLISGDVADSGPSSRPAMVTGTIAPAPVTTAPAASRPDAAETTATAQQNHEFARPKIETEGELTLKAAPVELQPPAPEIIEVARAEAPRPEIRTEAPTADADPRSPPVGNAAAASCRDKTAAAIDVTSIQFGYGSAKLPQPSFEMLDQLAAPLRSCPDVAITIAGHTDSDGHIDRNQRLSVRRAEAVRELLIAAGIEPHQILVIGRGQMRPLAPNDTDINKRRNRRIEFILG